MTVWGWVGECGGSKPDDDGDADNDNGDVEDYNGDAEGETDCKT